MMIRNCKSTVVNAKPLAMIALVLCLVSTVAGNALAGELTSLWEIGKADGKNAEFALAPGGYAQFKNDGFFVVGSSDPKKDWPYVQPGPGGWLGGGAAAHVRRALRAQNPARRGRMPAAVQPDRHAQRAGPPEAARGGERPRRSSRSLPAGAGDASCSRPAGQGPRAQVHRHLPGEPAQDRRQRSPHHDPQRQLDALRFASSWPCPPAPSWARCSRGRSSTT